jgi:hypothetical protein
MLRGGDVDYGSDYRIVKSLLGYQRPGSDGFDKPMVLTLILVQNNGCVRSRNVEDEVELWVVEELSHERISRVSEESSPAHPDQCLLHDLIISQRDVYFASILTLAPNCRVQIISQARLQC